MDKIPLNINSTSNFIQAKHKKKEQLLSDNIYKNLHILGLLSKPTDEFKDVFTKDMFIKSNVKAFPHVMHFLFNLLDPHEFKKRFYWPITDKTSEANFRTSTMNYLNHLNVKHHLKLENLKMHIVVLPGGINFMKILCELTKLVMSEEIRKRKKSIKISLPEKRNIITTQTLIDIQTNYNNFVEEMNLRIKKLEQTTTLLNCSRELLIKFITNIFYDTFINTVDILNIQFLNNWQRKLQATLKMELLPKVEKLHRFTDQTGMACIQIQKMFDNKQIINVCDNDDDVDDYKNAIKYLCNLNPEKGDEIRNVINMKSNQINVFNLFTILELIVPKFCEIILNYEYRNVDALAYEEKCIQEMYQKVIKVEQHSMRLERNINKLKQSTTTVGNGTDGDELGVAVVAGQKIKTSSSSEILLETTPNNTNKKCTSNLLNANEFDKETLLLFTPPPPSNVKKFNSLEFNSSGDMTKIPQMSLRISLFDELCKPTNTAIKSQFNEITNQLAIDGNSHGMSNTPRSADSRNTNTIKKTTTIKAPMTLLKSLRDTSKQQRTQQILTTCRKLKLNESTRSLLSGSSCSSRPVPLFASELLFKSPNEENLQSRRQLEYFTNSNYDQQLSITSHNPHYTDNCLSTASASSPYTAVTPIFLNQTTKSTYLKLHTTPAGANSNAFNDNNNNNNNGDGYDVNLSPSGHLNSPVNLNYNYNKNNLSKMNSNQKQQSTIINNRLDDQNNSNESCTGRKSTIDNNNNNNTNGIFSLLYNNSNANANANDDDDDDDEDIFNISDSVLKDV